jgi:hypothetical protein
MSGVMLSSSCSASKRDRSKSPPLQEHGRTEAVSHDSKLRLETLEMGVVLPPCLERDTMIL